MRHALLFIVIAVSIFTSNKAYALEKSALSSGNLTISSNFHQISLALNSNGMVTQIDSEGTNVIITDIQEVIYSSKRVGAKGYSTIKAPFLNNLATIKGLPNNDTEGKYFIKLKDGNIYRIKIEHFNVKSDKFIPFNISEEDGITYGKQAATYMVIYMKNGAATIEGYFGCNIAVGIKKPPNIYPIEAVFVTEDGISYSGLITEDFDGNLGFNISNISLYNIDPALGYKEHILAVRGKLYAYAENILYPFDFNESNWEKNYIWDCRSSDEKTNMSTDFLNNSDFLMISFHDEL